MKTLVLARMALRRRRHSVPPITAVGCWAVGRGAGGVALQPAARAPRACTAGWPWRARSLELALALVIRSITWMYAKPSAGW